MAKGKKSGNGSKVDSTNNNASVAGYRAFIANLAGQGKYGGKASLSDDQGDGIKDTLSKEGACFENDAVEVVREFADSGVIAGQSSQMTATVKKKSALGTKDGRLDHDDSAVATALMLGMGVTVGDVVTFLEGAKILKSAEEREKDAKQKREDSIKSRSASLFTVLRSALAGSITDKSLTVKQLEKCCDDVSADVENGNVKADGAQAAVLANVAKIIDKRGVGAALTGATNGEGK